MIFPTPIPDELLPPCDDDDLNGQLQDLYDLYARDLFIAFRAKCNDRERANDAVHEAYLRLRSHGLMGVKVPRLWLETVGNNWLLDLRHRDQRRHKQNSGAYIVAQQKHEADRAIEQEAREKIRASLRKTRDPDRNVLSLRYLMNWSSREIANHFGVALDGVEKRLAKARKRLAQALDDHQSSFQQFS